MEFLPDADQYRLTISRGCHWIHETSGERERFRTHAPFFVKSLQREEVFWPDLHQADFFREFEFKLRGSCRTSGSTDSDERDDD